MFEHGLARGDARDVRGEVGPVVRAEEEDAILQEKSPEIHAVVAALIVGQPHPAQRGVLRFIVDARARVAGAVVVDEAAAVEGVSSGLRDDVDDTRRATGRTPPGSPPVRTSTASMASLLKPLPCTPSITLVVEMPSIVHWLSAEVEPFMAMEIARPCVRAMIGHDAWMVARDVGVVAVHGEVDDHVAAVASRRRRRRRVHEGRVSRDQDLLAHGELQDQRNRRDPVRGDRHRLLDACKAGAADPQDVAAGRQRGQAVRSVLGRDGRSVRGRARAGRFDRDARERRAERIRDPTLDAARTEGGLRDPGGCGEDESSPGRGAPNERPR